MIHIRRLRWILTRKGDGGMEVLCSVGGKSRFRPVEDVGAAVARTFPTEAKAFAALPKSQRAPGDTLRAVAVLEKIEEVYL